MPEWMSAFAAGLLGGLALLLGCAVAWIWQVPQKVVAAIMAFGAGVLFSALAFELVDDAVASGGLPVTIAGFMVGAVAFVGANAWLARRGARHRKRSGGQQPAEHEVPGSGTAIAVGALLDGVPESLVLGLSMVTAGSVNPAMLGAVFLSNVPEGLSSAAGMKRAGRSAAYVFGIWTVIALLAGASSLVGFVALQTAPAGIVAAINALAAGAILAMIVDTMIPEAFEKQHLATGVTAAAGFATALCLDSI
ncbi:ZIP family metal transporter [Zhihengliuella salsuginis]|uniref:ZIP family zinc transporter n=1 Tax=Zhihengliuella salsuginis TaxID=578222 RepID=A0ABQ3GB03_9MICC|nr:ZIP family zinc transporter [Zhihengliuella salsuginis]GHC99401.1 ZIP family zinc transporter [Zhihengliuella salsuginis]